MASGAKIVYYLGAFCLAFAAFNLSSYVFSGVWGTRMVLYLQTGMIFLVLAVILLLGYYLLRKKSNLLSLSS